MVLRSRNFAYIFQKRIPFFPLFFFSRSITHKEATIYKQSLGFSHVSNTAVTFSPTRGFHFAPSRVKDCKNFHLISPSHTIVLEKKHYNSVSDFTNFSLCIEPEPYWPLCVRSSRTVTQCPLRAISTETRAKRAKTLSTVHFSLFYQFTRVKQVNE